MASFAKRLKVLFPDIVFGEDVVLEEDPQGGNPIITVWTRPEPLPTEVDVMSVTDQQVEDAAKDRAVDFGKIPPYFRAFVELLIDEINVLRATQSLPPRTLQQFKTAMRNKL